MLEFVVAEVWVIAVFGESVVEEASVDWLRALGYSVEGGPEMSPETDSARYPLGAAHADVVRTSAVRGSPSRRVNAEPPEEALADTLRKLTGGGRDAQSAHTGHPSAGRWTEAQSNTSLATAPAAALRLA
ncbi:MAG: hypothetical protein OXC31_13925 [Spirochaetaceae bacterium]|nr:hypothetical protein [Spirochaetaceae bacterium]